MKNRSGNRCRHCFSAGLGPVLRGRGPRRRVQVDPVGRRNRPPLWLALYIIGATVIMPTARPGAHNSRTHRDAEWSRGH
jgi:hypothetical protein